MKDKPFGSHHCPKPEIALSLKGKASNYQDSISRISVDITKKDNETLGLTVSGGADRGETPVIANIRPGSIAEKSDIFLIGDHIISINGISTSSLCHQEIVSLVKTSKPTITLVIDYELPEILDDGQKDMRTKQTTVTLGCPDDSDESYGFVIRGGYCKDPNKIRPLTVMQIRPGSVAERDGRVKPGDRILSIKNCKVDHLTPENVVSLFREHRDQLAVTVEYSVASVDMTAVSGRPIIVEIQKQVNERLGVSIATYHDSGTDSQIFYIENIEAGSVADRCGVLQVGQIITAIQDLRTDKMGIQDAIEALRSGHRERIKLRIIPNLHLDHIKWNQQQQQQQQQQLDKQQQQTERAMLQLVNSRDILSLTDDAGNLNTSNTDSLVGSDPLDLQCNCSEIYLGGGGGGGDSGSQLVGASSLRNISQTGHYQHSQQQHQQQQQQQSQQQQQHQFGQYPYVTRPKSVMGLDSTSEMLALAGSPPIIGVSSTINQQNHQHSQKYRNNVPLTSSRDPIIVSRKEQLSKSATSLFPQQSRTCRPSPLVGLDCSDGSSNKPCLEQARVILSLDSTNPPASSFGFLLRGPSMDSSEILSGTNHPRIVSLQPGQPAAASALLQENDRLCSVDDVPCMGRSLDHINAQLLAASTARTVTLGTLYEVRSPEQRQLLADNTVFEICLNKQAGSLGINLQALVTRSVGEPLIISKVLSGSAASRCGCIGPGDLLLALDNQPIDRCTLAEAVHLLQSSSDSVTLRIKKSGTLSGSGLQSQPPPQILSEAQNNNQQQVGVFTVDLRRKLPCHPWGIVISGTDDSADQPILIDSVNKASSALGVSRLMDGDQLLSINGQSLRGCTLTQAMGLLHQYPDRVRLTVLRQDPDSPSHAAGIGDPTRLHSSSQQQQQPASASTEDHILASQHRYRLNTKSLGRSEIKARSKMNDNQRFLISSMTLPPLRNSEGAINEPGSVSGGGQQPESVWSVKQAGQNAAEAITPGPITAAATTESDSSDSQTTTHSLFARQQRYRSSLSHQQASIDSNSSSGSNPHHSHLHSQHHHHQHSQHRHRKELPITTEESASPSVIIAGAATAASACGGGANSEVDSSSQADILESIQCPGCREAIENEWRSRDKLNDVGSNNVGFLTGHSNTGTTNYSRTIDRRPNRVHGGAVPMTVNLPPQKSTRSDSMRSNHESKTESVLLDQFVARKSGSAKDISSSGQLGTQLHTVYLCRKSPTESFGIGVSEGLSPKGTFISAIKPNSPASQCQSLQLYDEIVEVNGLSTENMRCSDVVTLISQSENSLELLIRKRRASQPAVSSNDRLEEPVPASISGGSNNSSSRHQRSNLRSSSLKRIGQSQNNSTATTTNSAIVGNPHGNRNSATQLREEMSKSTVVMSIGNNSSPLAGKQSNLHQQKSQLMKSSSFKT